MPLIIARELKQFMGEHYPRALRQLTLEGRLLDHILLMEEGQYRLYLQDMMYMVQDRQFFCT